MNDKMKKIIKVVVLVLIAVLSITLLSKYASSPDVHKNTITALDDKKSTVMELTAASTAASVAISALPGDAGTPIADKIVDLSSCFLIVLCALYLEKYLVTMTGYVTFVVLIPLACGMLAAYVLMGNETLRHLAKKLAIFGMAIVLVIPASVKVSEMIEETYNSSVHDVIESTEQSTEIIEGSAVEEEKGFWGNLLSDIKVGISNATTEAEQVLNHFIEALAVMLVTSCVIPILVIFFFIWLIKIILGVDLTYERKKLMA